jgi:hypothetical protein
MNHNNLYELGFQTNICGSYDSHNIARYVNRYTTLFVKKILH